MVHPFSRTLGCMLFALTFLAGCSWSSDPRPEGMHVIVNFGDVHRCSRISPEIVIYNPPRGTSYYEVRVAEADNPQRQLGGGRWGYGGLNEDGADIIPEGGLSSSYRAPCPSGTATTRYLFTVSAVSRQSGAVLGQSSYVLTLEQ